MRKNFIMAVVVALVVVSGWLRPAEAIIVTLLDENFDDVTGLPLSTSVRTIADIYNNNPSQLPTGTTWSPGFSATSVGLNVRRGDNTINTTAGSTGFDSFFGTSSSNRFLVLGDDTGTIAGDPQTAIRTITFPFTIPVGAFQLDVDYDFAFDGVDTGTGTDLMSVFLTLSDNSNFPLRTNSSPGGLGITGHDSFSFMIPDDIAVTGLTKINFQINESSSTATNTAAGFDNIKVIARIPEPATIVLLGVGVIALWAAYRRKR